jgi:phosphate transport system substrate-binding protein
MFRSLRLAPLALLILVPLLAACSRSRPEAQAKGSTNSIALTGAGATFPSVLYNRWLVKWPGNPIRAKGNQGVGGAIAGSDGRVGYVGYEFARKIGLDTAALENKEGKFLKPRPESCRAALAAAEVPENFRVFVPDPTGKESYPIVTFSWILLRKKYQDPATAKALQELFQWSLRDGQRYASELGYIQVPTAIAEKAQVALKSIGTEG